MQYPIYRKYFNETSYFKIQSKTVFEEIQLIGTKKSIITTEAKQYPEMIRIMDMIEKKDGLWVACSESEYENLKR